MKIVGMSAFSAITYPTDKLKESNFAASLASSFAAQQKTEKSATTDSLLAEIHEKGFLRYVEELREEKMREEILKQMGLTEEQLAEMSIEQRTKIEQLIATAIQKRQAAEIELFGEKDGQENKSLSS